MAVFKAQKEKLMLDGPENLNRLVIGAEIKGELSTQTSVRLDGFVTGTVTCGAKLVLGPKGKIVGNVFANQAEIEGEIEGDLIITQKLILRATSRVKGNIVTPKVLIEDGAEFNGSCIMSEEGNARTPDKHEPEFSLKENLPEDVVY